MQQKTGGEKKGKGRTKIEWRDMVQGVLLSRRKVNPGGNRNRSERRGRKGTEEGGRGGEGGEGEGEGRMKKIKSRTFAKG